MKTFGIFLISLFLIVSGCDGTGDEPNPTFGANVAVLIHDTNPYLRLYGVEGTYLGSPLPEIQAIRVGSFELSPPANLEVQRYMGEGFFNAFLEEQPIVSDGGIRVELETSAGTLDRTIELPEKLTLSIVPWRLPRPDENIEVSWTGQADYYYSRIYLDCESEGIRFSVIYDTLTTVRSLLFPGRPDCVHPENLGVYVQAINGPMPAAGQPANMKGEGFGYVWVIRSGADVYFSGEHVFYPGTDSIPEQAQMKALLLQRLGFRNK